jgi:hypothetical protein
MKFTSMFFTASASILEACFKLRISEREITSLLDYFSKRAKVYSSLSQIRISELWSPLSQLNK